MTQTTPDALPTSKEAEAEDLADAIVNFVTDWAAEDDEDTMRRDLERMFKRFGALSTAIPAGNGVPPGMVLVPREPTEAMYEAGMTVCDNRCREGCQVDNIYRAMLSTASTAGKG